MCGGVWVSDFGVDVVGILGGGDVRLCVGGLANRRFLPLLRSGPFLVDVLGFGLGDVRMDGGCFVVGRLWFR
jgi:hypothetical protein